ncbi:MAG: hypothetical protein IPO91_34580 [Chloroflexi bacterium]|nr:hypothetical protein [Chloroflexota bacterium]
MERVDNMLVIKTAVPAQAARLYANNATSAATTRSNRQRAPRTKAGGGAEASSMRRGMRSAGWWVRITAYPAPGRVVAGGQTRSR